MSVIELNEICKIYPMGRIKLKAVDAASFSIRKGEFAAISGPSGSGKSTLLNIIGLIDIPTSGTLLINGIDVYKNTDLQNLTNVPAKLDSNLTDLRHQNIGFIFQTFNLIPVLNVWENIELPLKLGKLPEERSMNKRETKDWIEFLIETVGLTGWKKHKPAELSGGQRQRVAIARALATKAPIILADEPTANLDSKNGDQILELMKKLNRELQTTFVFSTHDAKIVSMADHVIGIKDGQIQ
ncbi:ABC transporter ATP-binding protein [Treponema parvum]|uniref:ABC transporter ATP-binding protein n=1 Tax=Treponema parvum TaxID=138851 RepID=A0A975ICH1_9SPIR|nr:ABC transporter ATP-binding protein [Treponema parvum]QTQ11986.1 ABC transporter ATP-binding protein [Treponema parvum]QTQ16036.1 ABC transporter ATP-binding protein [Treponema parvum]